MDILLFPVKRRVCAAGKRGLAGEKVAWVVALALLPLGACGYRSLNAEAAGEQLCVLAAPAKVPDAGAVQSALDGARQELARHGALGDAGSHPCLVLELLRVDEAPAGIVEGGLAASPRARGTALAVVGRAWVESAPGAPLSRDTGDLRRVARLETTTGLPEGTRHDRGLEAAAQQLGSDLARRVLGHPTPSDELP